MTEAEKPQKDYVSVEDVFTRALKKGSRLVDGSFVSPADGTLVLSRALVNGKAVQAKGLDYAPTELVFGDTPLIQTNEDQFSWFTTVYLAPHNYHRVHSPVAGTLKCMRYIPGQLWPVNERAVKFVPNLFCVNERLVFEIDTGQGLVWAVMVGALNVGRMVTPFDPLFVTNSLKLSGASSSEKTFGGVQVNAGDELGTFMLGSTVVIILDLQAMKNLRPREITTNQSVRMGQRLCEI